MHKCKKRKVTLIEMMIVMFLIAMIIGVVAYNYQGTLEESKAFKTKAAKERLTTILTVLITRNPELEDDLESNWQKFVRSSPLVQNPNDLIKDGWGQEFDVRVEEGRVVVESEKYQEYQKKNPTTTFREEKE
ncbi:MAG: type II secretion system protein [Chlamydiales bacterium]